MVDDETQDATEQQELAAAAAEPSLSVADILEDGGDGTDTDFEQLLLLPPHLRYSLIHF
jgi:hypothetical protein